MYTNTVQLISLHCLSNRNVTEHFFQNNKTVFYRVHEICSSWRNLILTMKLGNTTLILYKDDFKFVSKFPFLLGHPVHGTLHCASLFPLFKYIFINKLASSRLNILKLLFKDKVLIRCEFHILKIYSLLKCWVRFF